MNLTSPALVVLIGPSGSGKSTWTADRFQPTEVVSSDTLRAVVGAGEDDLTASEAAFRLLDEIVRERTRRGMTTVIDSTGLDAESRSRWSQMARAAGMPVVAVAFDTPLATCLERNTTRERPVPQDVIKRQHRNFTTVVGSLEAEGYDRIETISNPMEPTATEARLSEISHPDSTASHSFGLLVSRFNWGERDLVHTLTSIAQRAEAAGFRDLWLMDHFRQIPSVGREWEDIPEPYTTLAHVAAHTSKLRLGVLVSGISHRHPVVLGQMIATLDNLSGGRAICGLGAAWDQAEHHSYGIPFPSLSERYEILAETLQMLPLLWGPGSPAFSGSHIEAGALTCYPRPIQDHIPILVGGAGEKRTLRLVAEHADACNLFGDPETVARKLAVLAEHCADVGRDSSEVEATHLLTAMTASQRSALIERADHLRSRNTPAETYLARAGGLVATAMIDLIARYSDAGADHSILALPDVHLEGAIESFEPVVMAFR